MRDTPIMTFINKLDREGKPPIDLLDEVESVLGIQCAPITWPIGMGSRLRGVVHLQTGEVHLYEPGRNFTRQDSTIFAAIDAPQLRERLGEAQFNELRDELELVQGASQPFDETAYLAGKQTPVFFGSAINNFGVREMLDAFVELAPQPRPRAAVSREVSPYERPFSGFAFKIQANMDPAHRDRIAFVRICSGKFTRGMKVVHHRIGKEITIANATIFMAQDRENVEEAFPGDIIGIHNHGTIKIGDTFSEKEPLKFTGIPNFAPEHFRRVILKNPLKTKQLQKGLIQLSEEGAVQFFKPVAANHYILGAVGVLQFEVTMARLKDEYGVDAIYEPVDFGVARWIACDDRKKMAEFERKFQNNLAHDAEGYLAFMTTSEWQLKYCMEQWPEVRFTKTREIY